MDETSLITLTPTQLVYGGEALGRLPDGRAVFIPFALPGETVRVRLVEEKRNFARAELVELLSPVNERIAPPCRHFGECGGCHYQHLAYETQLEIKRKILKEQLERIAGISEPPVMPCVPAPKPFGYRNQIEFHLTDDGKLGNFRQSRAGIFPLEECLLPDPAIAGLWPQLDFEALPEIERVIIRMGDGADLQLILDGSEIYAPEINIEELSISAVHHSPAGALVLAGSDRIVISVLGREFQVSSGSFYLANLEMVEKMVQHVLENLTFSPGLTILDAYCGVGLFSAFLAPHCARLIGIEVSSSASDDYVRNLDEFDHIELYEAPVEAVLPGITDQVGVILLAPPRVGIERHAMDEIIKLAAPKLVVLSSDPATLARDAKRLASGGYRLEKVTPFDMFPQTYHIESISFWEKTVH